MAINFNSINNYSIMNKILKYTLIGLGATSIIFTTISSFCSAGLIDSYSRTQVASATNNGIELDAGTGTCYMKTASTNTYYSFDNWNTQTLMEQHAIYCFTGTLKMKSSSTTSIYSYALDLTEQNCPTCEECEECTTMTSLECQTEYNLIPTSSITANYCVTNFNLIDPSECPIYEGTGAVNWSALYINETQYSSNDEINIEIPEDIGYTVTYNESDTNVYIEGYNADTEYIENVINQEKMTPTNEDISYFIEGLANYIPIIFVGVFIILVARIIRKIF